MKSSPSISESMGIISPQTLDRLWRERDPMARQRSSKPTFRSAVMRAMAAGATIYAIELALKANDAQGDGTRCRDHNFAKGCCRVLNGGQWEDFMEAEVVDGSDGARVLVTLDQLQKAVSALKRSRVRGGDCLVAYILTSDDRALLGFAFGPGDDDVIGLPGRVA